MRKRLITVCMVSALMFSMSACSADKNLESSASEATTEASTEDSSTNEEETVESEEVAEDDFIADEVFDEPDETHGIDDADLHRMEFLYSWDLDYEEEMDYEALYDYMSYLQGSYPGYAVLDEGFSNSLQSVWQGSGYRYGMKFKEKGSTDMVYSFRWTDEELKERVDVLLEEVDRQRPLIQAAREKKQEEVTERLSAVEDLPDAIKQYPSYGVCNLEVDFKDGEYGPYQSYYDLTEEELDKLVDLIVDCDRVRLSDEEVDALAELDLDDAELIYFASLYNDREASVGLDNQVDIVTGYHNGDEVKLYVTQVVVSPNMNRTEEAEVIYYIVDSQELEDYMMSLCELAKQNLEG